LRRLKIEPEDIFKVIEEEMMIHRHGSKRTIIVSREISEENWQKLKKRFCNRYKEDDFLEVLE